MISNIHILYIVLFIGLVYLVLIRRKTENFYVNIPELDQQLWGSNYLQNQCSRTSFNKNRAQNFEKNNCQITDLNDLELTINRRLNECRFYNEQDIVMGIDSESWCNLETENKNYHYVKNKIMDTDIVNDNKVGNTDEIAENIIPENINRPLNNMLISSNKINLTD